MEVELGGEAQINECDTVKKSKQGKGEKCFSCTESVVCLIDNLGKLGGWLFVTLVLILGTC